MSIIIRLQNLPWSANSVDIRHFFSGLSIPEGGVHIVGGEMGDAFIAFSTDEDARLAMAKDGGKIKDMQIKLLLSSRTEMMRVIEQARQQNMFVAQPHIIPAQTHILPAQPAILSLQQPARIMTPTSESERRRGRSPSPHHRPRDRSPGRDRRRSPDDRRGSKRDRSRSPSRSSRSFSRDNDRRNDRFRRDDRRYEDSRYRDDRRPTRDSSQEPRRYLDADHVNSRSQLHATEGFRNTQNVFDQSQGIVAHGMYPYGNQQSQPSVKNFPDAFGNTPVAPSKLPPSEQIMTHKQVDIPHSVEQKQSSLYPENQGLFRPSFEAPVTSKENSISQSDLSAQKSKRRTRFEPEIAPPPMGSHFSTSDVNAKVPVHENPQSLPFSGGPSHENYSQARNSWPNELTNTSVNTSWNKKEESSLNTPMSHNSDFLQVVPMDLDPSPSDVSSDKDIFQGSPSPYERNNPPIDDDLRRDNQNRGPPGGGSTMQSVNRNMGMHDSRGTTGIHNESRGTAGMHNESRGTTGMHNESRGTTGMHNESRGATGIHNESRAATGMHNESRAPTGIHNESRAATGMHNESRATTGMHTENRATSGMHNESRPTSGMHNESRATTGMHNESRANTRMHNESRATTGMHNENSITAGMHNESRGISGMHIDNKSSTTMLNEGRGPMPMLGEGLVGRQHENRGPTGRQNEGRSSGNQNDGRSPAGVPNEVRSPVRRHDENRGLPNRHNEGRGPLIYNENRGAPIHGENQGHIPPSLTVEVRGLPPDARIDDILNLFHGIPLPAANVRIEASDRGFEKAIIRFVSAEDFEEALNRNRRFMHEGRCELVPCPAAAFDGDSRLPRSKPKLKPRDEDLTVQLRGLPFTCKEEDVVGFFDGLGILDLFIDIAPDGRATGVGFVEFGTPEDFRAALTMNGKMIGHRYITVSVASREMMAFARGEEFNFQPKRPTAAPYPSRGHSPLRSANQGRPPAGQIRPPLNQGRPSTNQGRPPPVANQSRPPPPCISMKNLPEGVTNGEIVGFLAEMDIMPRAVHIMLRQPDKTPSGDAYVECGGPTDIDAALELNGKPMRGKRVAIKPISFYEMSEILGRPSPIPPPPVPGALLRTPGDSERPRRSLLPQGPGELPPFRERPRMESTNRGNRPFLEPPFKSPAESGRPFGPGRMRAPFPSRPPFNGNRPDIRGSLPPAERNIKDFGAPGCVVSINNLHFKAGLEELLDFFHEYQIGKDNIMRKYNEKGQTTGEARVAFKTPADAQRAVRKLNRREIMGRSLNLSVL